VEKGPCHEPSECDHQSDLLSNLDASVTVSQTMIHSEAVIKSITSYLYHQQQHHSIHNQSLAIKHRTPEQWTAINILLKTINNQQYWS